MTPNAQRQAAYRARYAKRAEALNAIITDLDGRTGGRAERLRQIATEGLK